MSNKPVTSKAKTDGLNETDVVDNKTLAPLSKMRPATLDNIEKAVHQLFAGENAQEVTMIQIAKTANVSLQTLYNLSSG